MHHDYPDDDPRWNQLVHYFAGELPPGQAARLRAWIDADQERQVTVARLQEVWRVASRPPQRWDVEAELERLRVDGAGRGAERRAVARVEPKIALLPSKSSTPMRWVTRLAAAVTIAVGTALLWQLRPAPADDFGRSAAVTTAAEYRTRAGQRLVMRLPDGTQVTLAPGSVLRTSTTYGRSARDVELEGEAYFVVTHDEARPFAVHTTHAVARDLGTRFVVRAYPDEAAAEVVVAEGLVAVQPSARTDSVVLAASQRARVTGNGRVDVTSEATIDQYLAWTEGRLVFTKAPLREVVRQLERWYDVDIRLADSHLSNLRLTVTLSDESPEQAIDLVADVLELAVSRSADGYVIARP